MKTIEVVAGVIRDGEKFFENKRGYGEFKDGWEFPGGKLEPGETPEEALVRELKEELAIDILVKDFICTVEYDYPKFHLTMHCFYCEIQRGTPQLLEHENAKWLSLAELNSVNFLPADVEVVMKIKREF